MNQQRSWGSLFLPLLLLLTHCSQDKNPINVGDSESETGYGMLLITTDSLSYSWREGETRDYVFIGGTLENQSDTLFYSRLGDGFGPAEQVELYIAANSEGYVESYDSTSRSWSEMSGLPFLIEGSRVVPIKPEEAYSINTALQQDPSVTLTGTFRIRVDYFEVEEPDSSVKPFQDFSNTFEIQ